MSADLALMGQNCFSMAENKNSVHTDIYQWVKNKLYFNCNAMKSYAIPIDYEAPLIIWIDIDWKNVK